MKLGILGPLLVADDAGREVSVAAARQRTLLAALLVSANRAVPVDELAEIVWDGRPPDGAARTLRSYAVRLRRAVGPAVAARIVTRYPGYVCQVAEDELDVLQFDARCDLGAEAVRARSWSSARELLADALALWRGAPLGDISSQTLRAQCVPRLEQARLQALEWRIEADLHLGRHEVLIPELQALVQDHPLREHGHAQLMLALYRCGRAAEALNAFQRARHVLVGELGVEPGSELQALHLRILGGDLALAAPPSVESLSPELSSPESSPSPEPPPPGDGPSPAVDRVPDVVPRQLPATVRRFTGRDAELARLSGLLTRTDEDRRPAMVISAIGGTAGVGKTALAVQWAHQVADQFPDGQLYVNLHGYDSGTPVSAADALAGFLGALGMTRSQIPAEAEQRAAVYRSLLAGRRMLILLDNACEPEQVRPLLPGTGDCVAVVTSRDAMAGLVARDGAVRLELDALARDEALALLRALIGARVDQDTDAAATLAARCCRLPLALRVAAELAAARPTLSVADLAAELADVQGRLDALDADGDGRTAIRAVFSWSYRHLDADVARVFRLIALHPGTDLDLYAAAALLGTDLLRAGRLLARLARAHLIQNAGARRYAMHDLLRAYARELADSCDGEQARRAAMTGLLDHYLQTAAAAMDTVSPAEARRRPRIAPPTGPAASVADPAAARAWLDAERDNLIAAIGHAADHDWPGHAIALSATVYSYFQFDHQFSQAITIQRHALCAARNSGDRAAEATALSHLGFAEWGRGRYEQGVGHQLRALALFQAIEDRFGQARVLHRLALGERKLGRLPAAARHAEQGLALARQVADRLGEARALQNLAMTQCEQGRFGEAWDRLRQVLSLLERLGDRRGLSACVQAIGVIDLRLGRLESAAGHFQRAEALCEEAGNRSGRAEALSLLGVVHLRHDRYQRAAEIQQEVLAEYRAIDDKSGQSSALRRLALAELRAGRNGQALEHLDLALEIAHTQREQLAETTVLNDLAQALLATAQPERAQARAATALDQAERTGAQDEQARAHHILARALTELGDEERARRHLRQALELYAALTLPEADQIRTVLSTADDTTYPRSDGYLPSSCLVRPPGETTGRSVGPYRGPAL